MKKILKNLPWIIVGAVSFVVVGTMDLILILMALLIRVTRSIFIRLLNALNLDTTDDDVEAQKNACSTFVNYGYKHYVDLMYPVKEDIEEDDEDE